MRESIESWSSTLWADLDVSILNTGAASFAEKKTKLPKHIRTRPPYTKLDEFVEGFKDSIPLIEDLKNEFVKDYVFPMFRANALYEGYYLLGTSIARPLIAKKQLEIAKKVGASYKILRGYYLKKNYHKIDC